MSEIEHWDRTTRALAEHARLVRELQQLERFHLVGRFGGDTEPHAHPEGFWVLWSDVAQIVAAVQKEPA